MAATCAHLTVDVTNVWDDDFTKLLEMHGETSPFQNVPDWVDRLGKPSDTKPIRWQSNGRSPYISLATDVVHALLMRPGLTIDQLLTLLPGSRFTRVQDIVLTMEKLGAMERTDGRLALTHGVRPPVHALHPVAYQIQKLLLGGQVLDGSQVTTLLPALTGGSFNSRRSQVTRCCQCLCALSVLQHTVRNKRMHFYAE